MLDIFELLVFGAIGLTIFALSYSSIHFFLVSKKMAVSFLESEAKVEFLLTKITETQQAKEEYNIEKSKAFLGFISESREKAFDYIEDVQSSIYQLKVAREALNVDVSKINEGDLEILRNVIDNVLKHLPDDPKDN